MAGGLMRYLAILLTLAGVALVSTSAAADALRDPTRPPSVGVKGAAQNPEASGWRLQSVLISPERRYAIINGEVVAVGGAVSGAQLLAVAPEQVTLRTNTGVRVVQLYPDVVRPDAGGKNLKHAASNSRGSEAGTNDNNAEPGTDVVKNAKVRKAASKNSRKQETP
jgi:MSHA biogenesis protein MshK